MQRGLPSAPRCRARTAECSRSTQDWNRWSPDITLTLLHDDGRGVSETLADYLETHHRSSRVLLVQPWSRSVRRHRLEHEVEHLANVVTCRQGPPT